MDAKTQIRIRKSLARGSSQSPFFPAFTAHAVIPAFLKLFFSAFCSLQTRWIADVMIAAANMAIRMPVLAVACMVSM